MRHKKNYILLIMLFVLGVSSVYSQEGQYYEIRDFETWTSAQIKFKTNGKWGFGINQQLRLDDNSTKVKGFITDFSTSYELIENLNVRSEFRWTSKNDHEGDVQGYEKYFRLGLDASYKHKIQRFDLKYRFKYTTRNEIGVKYLAGDIPVQYFRFKTSLGYNIKNWKYDPEISGEIFNKFEKGGQTNGYDKYRLTLGTSRKIKNYGKIGLYYRIENEIKTFYPKTTHIMQFKYSYTLNK